MNRPDNLNAVWHRTIKQEIAAYRKAANLWRKLWPCPAHQGLFGQPTGRLADGINQRVSSRNVVGGDEQPNFVKIEFSPDSFQYFGQGTVTASLEPRGVRGPGA